jgi:hypothetical protein
MRFRERARWAWDRFTDLWTIKDIVWAVVVLTGAGTLITPLTIWAFSPISPADFLVLALLGGLISFGLSAYFAPRIRHVYHHSTSVQIGSARATGQAGTLDFADTPLPLKAEAASRDRSLKEAMAFATTKKWGERLWEMGEGAISTTGKELEKFHQLARDGKLRVWGKLDPWGVHNPIPAEYWSNHRVNFLSLFRSEADIENDSTPPPHYRDLMVSRADFEREWP